MQSAIFYILACTPCAKVRHRHKAKQQAKKEREEKMRIEMEQPHLYRHPDPFSTNPFWQEEIDMGPSLPKKKGGSKNPSNSQRGLTSAGTQGESITTRASSTAEISNPGSAIQNPSAREPPTTASTAGVPLTTAQSTPTVMFEDTSSEVTEDWNHKRYQREDEELWGHEFSRTGQRLMDAIKQAGTSAGRYMESKLGMAADRQVTDTDRVNFYTPPPPTNPPVNDYHPPIVRSRPAHKDGYQWMLQPPPPAKVMEGKIPVSRSASVASAQSRRTTATEIVSLGRRVGEKAMEARIRKGETQPRPSTARTKSQPTTRSRSGSLSAESDGSEGTGRRRQRANRTPQPTVEDEDEDEHLPRSIESLGKPASHGYAAQRPRLSTILSSTLADKEPSSFSIDESGSPRPLREVQNESPEAEGNSKELQRPTGASMDSGLALQA